MDQGKLPDAPHLWSFFIRLSVSQYLHSSYFKYYMHCQPQPVHLVKWLLLLPWTGFDVTKWNRKTLSKRKKQSEILILNNVKSTCWLRFNIYLHFKENSQLNFSLPHPQHHSSSKQMRICCRVFCTHRDSRVFPILGWGHYGGSLTPTGNFLIPLLHQEKISAPMVHSPTK